MWVQQEVLSPGHRAPPPHTHTHTQILSQHLPHHPESLPRPVTCRAEGQKQEFITKHHSFALKPAVPPPGSRITQHGSSPGSAAALPHPRLLPTPSTAVPEGEKSGPGSGSEPESEPEPVPGPAPLLPQRGSAPCSAPRLKMAAARPPALPSRPPGGRTGGTLSPASSSAPAPAPSPQEPPEPALHLAAIPPSCSIPSFSSLFLRRRPAPRTRSRRSSPWLRYRGERGLARLPGGENQIKNKNKTRSKTGARLPRSCARPGGRG